MSTVNDIVQKIDMLSPFKLAEDYDNVGLIVGDLKEQARKALVCLDITTAVVDEAVKMGANLIICHHPPIFNATKKITKGDDVTPYMLLSNRINVIACHTNLDISDGGVNDVLFEIFGLSGKRHFMPPAAGERLGLGRIGQLSDFMNPADFANFIKERLSCATLRYTPGRRSIKNVAICGGSGASLIDQALKLNVDAFITGDIKHDVFIKAQNYGLTLIDAGHYATEIPGMLVFQERLSRTFSDLAFSMAENSVEFLRYI